jgi:hypothetical protein
VKDEGKVEHQADLPEMQDRQAQGHAHGDMRQSEA